MGGVLRNIAGDSPRFAVERRHRPDIRGRGLWYTRPPSNRPDQHARCVSRSSHNHRQPHPRHQSDPPNPPQCEPIRTKPRPPCQISGFQQPQPPSCEPILTKPRPPCQISGFQQPQPPSCESILTKPRPRTTNRLNRLSCPSRTGRQLADMTDNTSTKPLRKANTQIAHNTDANIRLFAGITTIMVLCACAVAWLVVLRRRETARRAIPAQTREESR